MLSNRIKITGIIGCILIMSFLFYTFGFWAVIGTIILIYFVLAIIAIFGNMYLESKCPNGGFHSDEGIHEYYFADTNKFIGDQPIKEKKYKTIWTCKKCNRKR